MGTKKGFLGSKEAIISLRSSGYRNTSMAIGELIDNSIQARADDVQIVLTCIRKEVQTRATMQIMQIAVIDNGHGMDEDILQSSLVLGEGENRKDSRGMGKFGVGLPQSSISQGKRVDAWSWMDGIESAKHAYIDLDNEEWLNDAEIKPPDDDPIPKHYLKYCSNKSGTVIMWSNLDNLSWKKANTVFDKCENQIGRMYRYWLNDNKVRIGMVVVDSSGNELIPNKDFQAVDPLFLMDNAKSGDSQIKPMFQLFVDPIKRTYTVLEDGVETKATVTMTFSMAKDEIRLNDEMVAGRTQYGKLAKECQGVSIVREGRELELTTQWAISNPKDPRHRWWGAEISFNRELDSVFGVTNSKQSATKINAYACKDYMELASELDFDLGADRDRDEKRLKEESPNEYILFDVITTVLRIIGRMSDHITTCTKKSKREKIERYADGTGAKQQYDTVVEVRSKNDSTQSHTDELVLQRGENRISALENELSKSDDLEESDKNLILNDAKKGYRGSIIVSPLDSSSFFSVERKDTQMIVKLNSNHSMYDSLFGIYGEMIDGDGDVHDLKIQASDALESLEFILMAWARMEDEDRDLSKRKEYRRIREKWGEIMEDSIIDD